MRIPRALITLLAASAVLVAACGGDGGDKGASGVVETPVAWSSFSPSVSPWPVVRSVAFSPAESVPVSSLRLWDTGSSWLQIEATRGRYDGPVLFKV